MNPPKEELSVPEVQTRYRERIRAAWSLVPGAKVLEIGCGQGDMTAVLASAVGPTGRVLAIDAAGRDYGAPLTLGQATDALKSTPIGPRIDFRFNLDLLRPACEIAAMRFDCAVLAHSSWYFSSAKQLSETLSLVRNIAPTLCFAEWDLQLHAAEQLPHLMAVLIQGQVESFNSASVANVRTPLTKGQIDGLLHETGWSVTHVSAIDTAGLQDADWEIAACFAYDLARLNIPPDLAPLIETQIQLLRDIARPRGNAPLPAYALVAQS